jgi:hypothetical protein
MWLVGLQALGLVSITGGVDADRVELTRGQLVLRRYRNGGWLWLAGGVIVPFLAAWGAYRGFRLWRWGRPVDGLPLLIVGTLVFAVRLALWAHTGFHSAL